MQYTPIYKHLTEEEKKDKALLNECVETLEELILKIKMDLMKIKSELNKK